jgi:hypothetical protein
MATLEEMTTQVAGELGLHTTDDQARIWRELNRGVRDVLLRTRCYVTTTTLSLTEGTGDYTLSANTLAINYAYVTGEERLLEPVNPEEIIERRLRTTSTDTSTLYAMQGANLLMVYPTPSSSGTLTFYYVPQPTAMSISSHDPSEATYGGIPDEYADAIEMYACWRLGSMRDDQTSGQGERYRILYEGQDGRGGRIAQIKREIHRKQGVRSSVAKVGRRRFMLSSDPSADQGYWG